MNSVLNKILRFPEYIFIVIALIFGIFYMFIQPYNEVPDENGHVFRACETASGILISKVGTEKTEYQKLIEQYINKDIDNIKFTVGYSPVMYISSAIGLKLGYFLYKDGKIMFYLGRFFNLITFLVLCAFAIKITPVFKFPFLICAILPMNLSLAPTYSIDSFNNAFAFLFFAYIFKLLFTPPPDGISKNQYIKLLILGLIGALCKGLIYPLILCIFLPRINIFLKALLILFPASLCILWNSLNPVIYHPFFELYNDKYLFFHQPLLVIEKIFLTTCISFKTFLYSMIGKFGNFAINTFSDSLYNLVILIIISMFFVLPEKIPFKQRITALLISLLYYLIVLYKQLITWTDVTSLVILGVQGRYFISILPFLFMVFSCNLLKIKEQIKNIYKIFILSFFIFINIEVIIFLYVFYKVYHLKTGFN